MKLHRLTVAFVLGLLATPLAIACWSVTLGPGADGYESPPTGGCTGSCNSYISCPGDDACKSGYFAGGSSCSCVTSTAYCWLYTGGSADSRGCCTGGTAYALGPTCLVRVCTVSDGDCWFW